MQSLSLPNPFKHIWHAYEKQLERNPVATQVTTSGLLWGAGDLIAQRIEYHEQTHQQQLQDAPLGPQAVPGVPKSSSSLPEAGVGAAAASTGGDISYDLRRAALTGVFGATLVGPVGHYWYIGLDKLCARWFTPGSKAFIATKVALDTAMLGPFYVSTFFGFGTAFIDRGTWADFTSKMRTDFVTTLAAEVTFWPLVQTLNFSRVPVQHQLLVVNSMTVVDVAFMSWARSHQDWLGMLLSKGKASQGSGAHTGGSSSSSGKALPVEPLKVEGAGGGKQKGN